jgi:hypothetical protein
MERPTPEQLSLAEAKARLRAAARGNSALAWLSTYPREGVLAAFVLGVVVGTFPAARAALASGIVALLKRPRP